MEINRFIAEAFWVDYCAEVEVRKEDAGSHIKILMVFLEWLAQRAADGPVVDLRLVRNQAARVTVNKIMGVDNDQDMGTRNTKS